MLDFRLLVPVAITARSQVRSEVFSAARAAAPHHGPQVVRLQLYLLSQAGRKGLVLSMPQRHRTWMLLIVRIPGAGRLWLPLGCVPQVPMVVHIQRGELQERGVAGSSTTVDMMVFPHPCFGLRVKVWLSHNQPDPVIGGSDFLCLPFPSLSPFRFSPTPPCHLHLSHVPLPIFPSPFDCHSPFPWPFR